MRVDPATPGGALAPRLDGDDLVLRGKVREGTEAPIGINVDSSLLLDSLEDGTVFDVEVLVPRSSWRSARSGLQPPTQAEAGCIAVTEPGPKIYVDALIPTFEVDREARLHIVLEPIDNESHWVMLSPGCYAAVNDGFLAGFAVSLADR